MGNRKCIQCRKVIDRKDKVCKYCGTHQYGENDEFYPTENTYRQLQNRVNVSSNKQRYNYSDEEILALGLYPKDEGYKMSLISRILGKR